MLFKKGFWFLLLISFSISAQIKGVVKDSISGKPIPYVNILVENENIGTTSEENGEFVIYPSEKSKRLYFSCSKCFSNSKND
jgi:CarboxypepD_reg-like domain